MGVFQHLGERPRTWTAGREPLGWVQGQKVLGPFCRQPAPCSGGNRQNETPLAPQGSPGKGWGGVSS